MFKRTASMKSLSVLFKRKTLGLYMNVLLGFRVFQSSHSV